nr:YfhO family protein [Paludibacteraceae bacterium]
GAIAFALGSYNLIIIIAGHNTKAVAIAYMAPIIGSVYLAFKEKRLVGVVLLTLFLGLSLFANHIQITYYTLFIVLCFGVSEFIFSIIEKKITPFFATVGMLFVGVIIAVGLNATRLLTTAEYADFTMRGASNGLSLDAGQEQKGLSKDYITQWSYGIDETLTLFIPNFKGGASVGKLSEDSHTAVKFAELSGYKPLGRELTQDEQNRIDRIQKRDPQSFAPKNLAELMYMYELPLYWGTQPFTSGPVYIGAIVIFLFFAGLYLLPARDKWWMLAATLLGIMLAWGKNFMPLTDFFIDYVPMYNKFRTVSMTLTIPAITMTLLAMLTLKAFFNADIAVDKKRKALYIGAGITGGLALLIWLFPSLAGSGVSDQDINYTDNFAFLQQTLPQDRLQLVSNDAFRSLVFVVLAALVIWLALAGKIKNYIAYIAITVLFTADMLPIASRYLNEKSFVPNTITSSSFPKRPVDKLILEDKDPNYRVLDLTVDIFNSAVPSYYHKTIGGYHAAKMRRYQELIDIYIGKQIQDLSAAFNTAKTENDVQEALSKQNVLNMLNMKYLVYHADAPPMQNGYAAGNAWFVSNIVKVASANEEMLALGDMDISTSLVVDTSEVTLTTMSELKRDSLASIELTHYSPNELQYTFSSASNQIAVFSEIYYDKGWNAYVDGKLVPHFRANYLLRAMQLPAGTYDIEFRFEPKSYAIGNILSLISSILLTFAFLGIIFAGSKNRKTTKAN